jgi:tetratricopeptide (TPR) repeat protein
VEFHLGFQGFLFLASALCHIPVWVYIALFQSNRLLGTFFPTFTGSSFAREPAGELSPVKEWKRVEELLQGLANNPLDARRREALADSYLRLGTLDSAISEYRKAADSLDSGPEQARLLYRAAYVCVEKRMSVKKALPLLRRLVRLYPRSYYAAYSRRILNRYEAYEAAGLLNSGSTDWWDGGGDPPA